MSHELVIGKDKMFTVRTPAWHGLGTVLDKNPKSVEAALQLAGLDWQVELRPLHVATGLARGKKTVLIEGQNAVVRMDTGDVLGLVSDRYKPVQNRDAFQFLDNVLGEIVVETAGSLQGGRRVWLMTRLPDHFTVGGDDVLPYVFISTSHDAKQAVVSACTTIRIVCMNTLTWALNEAMENDRAYSVRHLGDPTLSLQDARDAMGLAVDYNKLFKKLGDKMAGKKVGEKKALAILQDIYPVTNDAGTRSKNRQKEVTDRILAITYGKTDDQGLLNTTGNAPGSAWALANAIAEQQDHYALHKGGDEKAATATFTRQVEDPYRVKDIAFHVVAEAAGVSLN